MNKLRSFSTKYFSYSIQDNRQGYTITQHVAGGIDKKTLNFPYSVTKEAIQDTFFKYN